MKKNIDLVEVLLVEDNPGDVEITKRAFKKSKMHVQLKIVNNGEEALDYVFKRGEYINAIEPDIILLDLNLPKIDGFEVLETIKVNEEKKHIPIIVLTTSSADNDILHAYKQYANSFITKPVDFDKFIEIIQMFKDFWLTVVKLPK